MFRPEFSMTWFIREPSRWQTISFTILQLTFLSLFFASSSIVHTIQLFSLLQQQMNKYDICYQWQWYTRDYTHVTVKTSFSERQVPTFGTSDSGVQCTSALQAYMYLLSISWTANITKNHTDGSDRFIDLFYSPVQMFLEAQPIVKPHPQVLIGPFSWSPFVQHISPLSQGSLTITASDFVEASSNIFS